MAVATLEDFRMKPSHLIYVLTLAIAAPSIGQTVYQSTDAQGNPVFTDKPKGNAKPVELRPVNTTPSITPNGSRQSTPQPSFAGYQSVSVAVPSSIPNGLAPTTVGIVTQPALQPGHSWQLSLDGVVVAAGAGASTTLDQMERGTHQFSVSIIDQSGTIVGQSEPVEVFVFWPSKNR